MSRIVRVVLLWPACVLIIAVLRLDPERVGEFVIAHSPSLGDIALWAILIGCAVWPIARLTVLIRRKGPQ